MEKNIINERIDDIPLLLAQMKKMCIGSLLDKYFLTHGNWQGLSLGNVTEIWLSHILSEANHRLNHVEPWAEKRQNLLKEVIGSPVRPLDFSDDRLAAILLSFSNDELWSEYEQEQNRNLIRVYDLDTECIRLDSTTVSSFRDVSEDGLFRFGHSKDHRPDLPQLKLMLSGLDPLGCPLCSVIVSGEKADDPLYLPVIEKVRNSFDHKKGLLFIGDCKLASLDTRQGIALEKDYYLCPLSAKQISESQLKEAVKSYLENNNILIDVSRDCEDNEKELIAKGFESEKVIQVTIDDKSFSWTERRVFIQSIQYANAAKKGLDGRIGKLKEEIENLNKRGRGRKRWTDQQQLESKVRELESKYKVENLFDFSFIADRNDISVMAELNGDKLAEKVKYLGWKVYATNCPCEKLGLKEAVLAYRNEYKIEKGFSRLKGHPLSLTPMYLQKEEHVVGLIRLLTIALRIVTLIEYIVRSKLADEKGVLTGIYKGNKKRSTATPTTELLLKGFEEITLTIIHASENKEYYLTGLTNIQKRILELLGLSIAVYTRLLAQSLEPSKKMSEP